MAVNTRCCIHLSMHAAAAAVAVQVNEVQIRQSGVRGKCTVRLVRCWHHILMCRGVST